MPAGNGRLERPEFVVFDTIGWKPNPFLQSKIRFKPPIVETLAREAGIDPGVLDLLKKLGLTSEADLRARLSLHDIEKTAPESISIPTGDDNTNRAVDKSEPTAAVGTVDSSPSGSNDLSLDAQQATTNSTNRNTSDENYSGLHPAPGAGRDQPQHRPNRPTESTGSRVFISYIAADPNEEDETDPDGIEQKERMELEEKATTLILNHDARLRRTPLNNRGFDLVEVDGEGQTIRWVEVKAMTGDLTDRPICLSRAQFDCAWIHGEAYWLYIVEHAGDNSRARLLRIQDPAGKAKNFSFDQGWRSVAIT